MTTPLFWKSAEICNQFNSSVLKYPFFGWLEPKKEIASINKSSNLLYLAMFYPSSLILILMLCLVVVYGHYYIPSLSVSQPQLLTSAFLSLIISLCLVLTFIYFTTLPVFFNQYLNSLFDFERRLLGRFPLDMTQYKLKHLLHKGN